MTRISLSIAGIACVALVACEPVPPGQEDPNRRAKTGAAIGAVVGGLIGASSSDDKLAKGTVGAVIGGAIGGTIGNQLDKQAEDLRRDLDNDQIRIENTGTELRVTMPQDLLFDVDSTFVRPDLQSDLTALANNLRDYPGSTVLVIGHTDDTGSDAYNFDLSERRAAAVAGVLERSGVSPARLRPFGRGESEPIASNASEAGRAQNRRVEIIIRPDAV